MAGGLRKEEWDPPQPQPQKKTSERKTHALPPLLPELGTPTPSPPLSKEEAKPALSGRPHKGASPKEKNIHPLHARFPTPDPIPTALPRPVCFQLNAS